MSKSFVKPPVEDKMINENGYLTPVWREWFIDTWQSLDDVVSQAGIKFPVLTTEQRDSNDFIDQSQIGIVNSSLNGLAIYNTTVKELQIVDSGAWVTIVGT